MSPLSILDLALASGGLVLMVVTIGLYFDYFYNQSSCYTKWVAKFAWPIVMLTTIGSVVISLVYSEYFGFIPCSLCWLQRIAIYPQALLSVMAFKLKDTLLFPLYSIGLSVFGFGVGVYHYIYQMKPTMLAADGVMPCLADGSADCATKVIDQFGFVTFPLLSAITFAFLIVMYLNLRRHRQV